MLYQAIYNFKKCFIVLNCFEAVKLPKTFVLKLNEAATGNLNICYVIKIADQSRPQGYRNELGKKLIQDKDETKPKVS
jgi:hypothetical protein